MNMVYPSIYLVYDAVCFSVAVINITLKSNLGKKRVYFIIARSHRPSRGKSGQGLEQKNGGMQSAGSLSGLLGWLSYIQTHLPRDSASFSGLDPFTSIINQTISQTWPQSNLIKANCSIKFLSSRVTLGCAKLWVKTNQDKTYLTTIITSIITSNNNIKFLSGGFRCFSQIYS